MLCPPWLMCRIERAADQPLHQKDRLFQAGVADGEGELHLLGSGTLASPPSSCERRRLTNRQAQATVRALARGGFFTVAVGEDDVVPRGVALRGPYIGTVQRPPHKKVQVAAQPSVSHLMAPGTGPGGFPIRPIRLGYFAGTPRTAEAVHRLLGHDAMGGAAREVSETARALFHGAQRW